MKVVLLENPELNNHFNMNVDQSTCVILIICKNVIHGFFGPAHEMPTLIFYALFHHDTGGENQSILGRIGGYIFF